MGNLDGGVALVFRWSYLGKTIRSSATVVSSSTVSPSCPEDHDRVEESEDGFVGVRENKNMIEFERTEKRITFFRG